LDQQKVLTTSGSIWGCILTLTKLRFGDSLAFRLLKIKALSGGSLDTNLLSTFGALDIYLKILRASGALDKYLTLPLSKEFQNGALCPFFLL
jgi:hypothetical protein